MNETPGGTSGRLSKPSVLLPLGATVLVVAALSESVSKDDFASIILGIVGVVTVAGAWLMAAMAPRKLDPVRGVRFFSIASIALAVSGLLNPEESMLGLIGLIGLWLAVGGAAIEWRRGRTYSLKQTG